MSGVLVFIAGIISLACIYSVMTLALNLHYGRGGIINLGMVAFFAVGAYTCTIFTVGAPSATDKYIWGFGMPLWVGFIAAGVVTGIFAWIIGKAALRLRGEYLAISTFAFAEAVRLILMNAEKISNGLGGFWGLRAPLKELFPGTSYSYVFMIIAIIFLVASYIVVTRLERSPFGRVLTSIRENEEVSIAVGKDVWKFRVKTFTIGAILAGLAGAMYSWSNSLVVPSMFIAAITFTGWSALTIGGIGNSLGAIIATFILIGAQELTRLLQVSAEHATMISSFRGIIMGLIIVLLLRFKPEGFLSKKKKVNG